MIFQCYAPTDCDEDEGQKDKFYSDLQEVVNITKPKDFMVIMGDFNAKVGINAESYLGVIGKHGINDWSENGNPQKDYLIFAHSIS